VVAVPESLLVVPEGEARRMRILSSLMTLFPRKSSQALRGDSIFDWPCWTRILAEDVAAEAFILVAYWVGVVGVRIDSKRARMREGFAGEYI